MGAKYTEGQKKAIMEYMKDKEQIKITVTSEKANQIRELAKGQGKSITRFIIDCIDKDNH